MVLVLGIVLIGREEDKTSGFKKGSDLLVRTILELFYFDGKSMTF